MLGDKIAQLRKEKNASQEELADIFNTSRQAISKWERGESYPDIDRLKELAIYFNVSIDYLLDYDIESNSVDSFIKKLDICIQNSNLNISIEEIKAMVSKYQNNFELLTWIISYLSELYYVTKDESLLDLTINYSNRLLLLYKPNNSLSVTLGDIYQALSSAYFLKKEYEVAKNYIIEHDVADMDSVLYECEFQLGNKGKSSEIAFSFYLRSIMNLIESSTLQINQLLKTNEYNEAYEMVEWISSFIKSIEKKGVLFLRVIYVLVFIKASIEKTLNLDYKDSLTFLKEKYEEAEQAKDDTESIKFIHLKKTNILTVYRGIKEEIEKTLASFELDSIIYQNGSFIYKELFEE